jgi:hypothetical protein
MRFGHSCVVDSAVQQPDAPHQGKQVAPGEQLTVGVPVTAWLGQGLIEPLSGQYRFKAGLFDEQGPLAVEMCASDLSSSRSRFSEPVESQDGCHEPVLIRLVWPVERLAVASLLARKNVIHTAIFTAGYQVQRRSAVRCARCWPCVPTAVLLYYTNTLDLVSPSSKRSPYPTSMLPIPSGPLYAPAERRFGWAYATARCRQISTSAI